MRVTSQYLYNNFNRDQQKVNESLKKVSEQISSGQIIQDAYEDPGVFDDTLRLDSQINELKSVQERTSKAQNFATSTDDTLQDFTDSLRTFKTRLIAAANDSVNDENREAIATELEEEKEHMMRLANTQIGGEYLFSGSALSVKPIDSNGNYHGNDKSIETVIGEGVSIPYNIDGESLFLGSNDSVHKVIETNVSLRDSTDENKILQADDALKDLVGDDGSGEISFTLAGTKRDGSAVKESFVIDTDQTIETLLNKIGEAYGNSDTSQAVKVELNDNGNIVVTDLQSGKSQLEMKLHGDYNGEAIDFIKSDYTYAQEGIDDSAFFEKNGSTLKGNVALIADGELATEMTKLEDISNGALSGKTFVMKGKDVDGNDYELSLSLDDPSTFTVGGTTYNVYNADGTQTSADQMTMKQLDDIAAMVVSGTLPADDSSDAYNDAIVAAAKKVDVSINQSGEIEIHDKTNDLSNIEFSLYDQDANNFAENPPSPTLAFNSNNAVTTQKAQMDFFAQLDEIIDAVRTGKSDVSSEGGDPRNIGIQNAIAQIDQFDSHFNTQLAKVGTIEKSLQTSEERAMTMEVNLKTLKSDLTDVDEAEAYLRLNDLSLTYQAILSSVTKINSLTLLNYMK